MWTNWQRLVSSNLKATRYNPETEQLSIQFLSGHSYEYTGVPSSAYQGLLEAPSPGKFFNAQIKDNFPEA